MSYDIIKEDDVPKFTKRIGDHVLAGSNNSYMVFGTDRATIGPAKLTDGLGHINTEGGGKGTGTIHIVTGIKDKDGNPDLNLDSSYIYVTMKTEVDKNAGTMMEGDVGKSPAIIMKSDAIRTIFRKDIKIALDGSDTYAFIDKDKVIIHLDDKKSIIEMTKGGITIQNDNKAKITLSGDKITIDAGTIELGEGAGEQLILGNSFMAVFNAHTHISAASGSPTGPPLPVMTPAQLSSRKALVK